MLETVYEVVLEKMLRDQGLEVERQKPIPSGLPGSPLKRDSERT